MTALVLRLAAPMQSWGSSSKFSVRDTEAFPTRSGIIGMLAAAKGIRRTESLEDFIPLRFGVRLDQPGKLLRDYHTIGKNDSKDTSSLSTRFYIEDAIFLVVIEGEQEFITGLDNALESPYFPIYLGRKSCPPIGRVSLGIRTEDISKILSNEPWLAAKHVIAKTRTPTVTLRTIIDADLSEKNSVAIKDIPVSFDSAKREYLWRYVINGTVNIPNPDPRSNIQILEKPESSHDPFSLL